MKKLIVCACLLFLGSQGITAQNINGQPGPKRTKNVKYLATIEFFSKGAGIDNESFGKIEKYIKDHPKKPAYEIKKKGKEGEKVIHVKLTDLNKDEQKVFMDDVKKLVAKPDMVKITENGVVQKINRNDSIIKNNVKYRLVISFISQGAGLDRQSFAKIMDYINKHPKKPAFEEQHWGREGETDYYLRLDELSSDEQKVFVEDIKNLIVNKEMVFMTENQEYVKKGR